MILAIIIIGLLLFIGGLMIDYIYDKHKEQKVRNAAAELARKEYEAHNAAMFEKANQAALTARKTAAENVRLMNKIKSQMAAAQTQRPAPLSPSSNGGVNRRILKPGFIGAKVHKPDEIPTIAEEAETMTVQDLIDQIDSLKNKSKK